MAVLWVEIARRKGRDVVLDLCDVAPADEIAHARLFNVAGGMCAAMGLGLPDLYVIQDPALNALAVGRDDRHASLIVTQGLLDETTLVELEGVVALELYRIKAGDVGPETFIVPTVGASAVLSEHFERWQLVSRLFGLAAPIVDWVVVRLHPALRELETDLLAVEFTRYPPGLAQGLDRMAGRSAVAVAIPVTAHLWAAPPISTSAHPSSSKVHAHLSDRIAVLQEL